MAEPFPLGPAVWSASAVPALPVPALDQSIATDVCVVGAGYAGLSTALHLAERGVSVAVLEAQEPGWGGSGRNGGQVIPGLKYDPRELTEKFGAERGGRLVDFVAHTADAVFDLIDRHGMNVPRVRTGWMQGAHSPEMLDVVTKRADDWASRGVAGARVLGRDEIASMTGTPIYHGGWIDPRGGAIQPLSFVRELARVAQDAGARIFAHSPVERLERVSGKWRAVTRSGAHVTADKVVICTNAYVGKLWPRLRETMVAPNSFQVATAALSHNVRRSILPQGQVISDTRTLNFYYRLDHEGRLLMGGRGPLREPRSVTDWGHLDAVLAAMFPAVKGVPIEHRWCGRVAVTRDFLPHLHAPEPGLILDIGCMGRGVGLQTALGRALADYTMTGDENALPFPLTPIRPLPLHAFHRAYLGAIIAWHRMRDGRVPA